MEKFETSLKIPINYIHLNKDLESSKKPLVLFFHGFADSAKSLLGRAFPDTPTEVEVLAINGPFPLPQKKDGGWKHAYAWYFVDFHSKEVHIHPNVSVAAVHDLLVELKLEKRPKIIVGFSQGGFFVPYLLKKIVNVKQIFTIGSLYRADDYPDTEIKIDALHGEKDIIVSYEQAKETFSQLKQKKSIVGTFTSLSDMGHNFTEDAREWLKTKILKAAEE